VIERNRFSELLPPVWTDSVGLVGGWIAGQTGGLGIPAVGLTRCSASGRTGGITGVDPGSAGLPGGFSAGQTGGSDVPTVGLPGFPASGRAVSQGAGQ